MDIKEDIIEILRDGPMLPVEIMNRLKLRGKRIDSILLGAYLSELIKSGKINTSYMKIGGSPLYYLANDKEKLMNFSEHLKGPLKEAYELIKNEKVLKNDNLEPKIRVALGEIRDFARKIEILYNGESILFWKWEFEENVKDIIKDKLEKNNQGYNKENPDSNKENSQNMNKEKEESLNDNREYKEELTTNEIEQSKEKLEDKKKEEFPNKSPDEETKEPDKINTKNNHHVEIPILNRLKNAGIEVVEYKIINKKNDLKINAIVNSDVGKIPMSIIYKNKKITNNDLIDVLEIKNYMFITLVCKDASKSVFNSARKLGIHILLEKEI